MTLPGAKLKMRLDEPAPSMNWYTPIVRSQSMNTKQLTRSALWRLGISVTRFPAPHMLSRKVGELIRASDINIVLDVGAFHGTYCEMLRTEARYTGLIASFEPCEDSFRILSTAMRGDKNWRGYPFGLGNCDTVTSLNKYDQVELSSLLTLREEGARAYGVGTHSRTTEAIQLHKIDTIWDEIMEGVESPRVFLKTDAQGVDTAAVLGAAGHLQYVHGIQSELPVVEIYEGMVSLAEALQLYRKLGYIPVGFYPLGTREAYGLSPEFDVVFRRSHA